jgi:2-methylcitrate dehydratase PrpD
MGFQGRMDKRDPKKNPKHTANTQKESYTTNQIRKQDLDSMRDKIRSILENEYKDRDPKTGEMDNKPSGSVEFDGGAVINPIGDPREMPTAINLVKNKLRARGMKL